MKENKGFISFQCKVATRKSKMGPVLDFPVTKYISSWTKNIVNDLLKGSDNLPNCPPEEVIISVDQVRSSPN